MKLRSEIYKGQIIEFEERNDGIGRVAVAIYDDEIVGIAPTKAEAFRQAKFYIREKRCMR